MRNAHGIINRYDGSNKTNVISCAADLYEVCLHNNVVDHMYRRVKDFFKAIASNIPSYHTLHYLFNSESKFRPHQDLIDSLQHDLSFTGNFRNLNQKWWTRIPFLYRLQQWRLRNNIKSFKVFPILSHKRHHVSYDGQSFQQLLRTWNACPANYTLFHEREDEFWRKYFKVEDVETKNHKFFNSIKTNGISVSIIMKRKVQRCGDYAGEMKHKFESDEYNCAIGFDPSERLAFAGVKKKP